jgi:hypothetical protein
MKKKNRNHPKRITPANVPDPPWLHDNPDATPIPYTEEELDKLVEGFIAGNSDSPAWIELVQKFGFTGAKQILRDRFINRDPNINKERIHRNVRREMNRGC